MNVSPIIKYRTLGIAKGLTPIKSGNLRHNATKLTNMRASSWSITYSTDDAFYIEFVEEGTSRQRPQKFIARTSLVLAQYLTNLFNGKPVNHWKYTREALSTAKDTPERQLRHFESTHKMGNISWR